LVLPYKEPADVEAILGLELAWTAVDSADIVWPQVPFAWLVGPAGLGHVAHARCAGGVLAWAHCGKILFGLMERNDDAQRRLRRAYRAAFGADARPVKFILPW
jgi:hypothetical protein